MDKLARRSGRLSITTLTIINRIENPFPRWIDSFASLWLWVGSKHGWWSRPLRARRPMTRALTFSIFFPVYLLDYVCCCFTQISDRYMIQEGSGSYVQGRTAVRPRMGGARIRMAESQKQSQIYSNQGTACPATCPSA